jgi:proliferating cell nuclear antigen
MSAIPDQLLSLSKAKALKNLLDAVRTVIPEESNIVLKPEGLTVPWAMDPSHVMMVELVLPSGFFDYWNVVEEKVFAMNLKWLDRLVLQKVGKEEDLSFTLDESDPKEQRPMWTISCRGIHRRKKFPYMEPIIEEVPSPRIFFKGKIRIILATLHKVVSEIDSTHVKLRMDGENLTVKGVSDLVDEETPIPLTKHSDDIIDWKLDEDCESTFTGWIIADILKGCKAAAEVVTIEMAQDMPLKIEAEIPEGRLQFYVAPCIGV